ncbi:MAG: cytochrome P450, partial [Myxococcota bacterium]
ANDPLAFFDDLHRDYGDIVPYRIGGLRFWAVASPTGLEQVLVTDAAKLHKDLLTKQISRLLGDGLLTSDDPLWRKQRKLAAPSFTPRHIAAYAEVMAAAAARVVDRILASPSRAPRDIQHELTEVSLEVVLRTLFGTFDEETAAAGRAIGSFLEAFEAEVRSVYRLVPWWLPTPMRRTMAASREVLERYLVAIIEARRQSGEERDDLLGRLLAARDEDGVGMSDAQLRDEAITIFSAGHETVALSLTYATWLLARHPDVQEAVGAEIDAVVGARPPGLGDVGELPLLDAVLQETMRLYPPAWLIGRHATEPLEIDGHAIREGDQLHMPVRVVHHDPRYWTGPEAFRPVRWQNGETDDLPRFAYLPFGGGPRTCIGNHYALLEAKLVLAAFVQRLRFRPDSSGRLVVAPLVTLRPRDPVTLVVEPR